MFNLPTNNHLAPKCFASTVFVVLLINLVVGGVLIPHQEAQAVVDIIGGPSGIINNIRGWGEWAWKKVQEAYKTAGVWVTAATKLWEKIDTKIKDALNWAWKVLRKKLLNMLVDDIIKWIQGGGTPRIVSDWQGFLKSAADQVAGQFIEKYLGMGYLCKSFDVSLRIMLAAPPTFDRAASCSLSDITKNIQGFYDNIQKGGWKSWISVSETQNNMYGMYLSAQDYKWGLESAAQASALNEGISSSGFLGDKVCMSIIDPLTGDETYTESSSEGWKASEIPEGFECSKWQTRTPGRIAADAMSKSGLVDIDWLISSDEFAEYAGAIMDAVINRVIKEGVTRLTTSGGSSAAMANGQIVPGVNAPANVQADLSSYADATGNSPLAQTLAEQQKLLNENLTNLIKENQTSWSVLNSIKSSQISAFTTLKDTIQRGCPLPSAVSQVTISTQNTSSCVNNACPCTSKTVEKIKVTASGTGEGVLEKTTTQNYASSQDMFNICSLQTSSIVYQVSSSTAAVEQEIVALNTEITALKNKVSKFTVSINDNTAYQKAADAYMAAYDSSQNNLNNASTTNTTVENTMKEAKKKAVASNQAALSISSSDFNEFLQKTSDNTNEAVQKMGDIAIKRGGITDCAYAYLQPNALYTALCSAQSTANSYSASLSSCSR